MGLVCVKLHKINNLARIKDKLALPHDTKQSTHFAFASIFEGFHSSGDHTTGVSIIKILMSPGNMIESAMAELKLKTTTVKCIHAP